MPAIIEGRLVFDFPDADFWYAFKYDDKEDPDAAPNFYRERVEKIDGIRGVDIVAGIRPHFHTLTLLEVKDFRGHANDLKAELRGGNIPLEILQKALHTCSGLYLGARCHDALLDADLRAAILVPPRRLELIFLLAEDPIRLSLPEQVRKNKRLNRRRRREDILTQMRRKLEPLGIVCDLADLDDLPPHCGWTVTSLS